MNHNRSNLHMAGIARFIGRASRQIWTILRTILTKIMEMGGSGNICV